MTNYKDTIQITDIFRALSDPGRFRIVKMLEKKDLCVCEITAILGLAPSTVSKHLSILRDAGLITDDKKGKWVNYRLNIDLNNEHLRYLIPLLRGWGNDDPLIRQDGASLGSCSREKLCGLDSESVTKGVL